MTSAAGPRAVRPRVYLVPPGAPSARLEIVVALAGTIVPLLLWLLPVELFAGFAGSCRFHDLTGLPCPTCGTTRGILALAHGDLATALRMNPLLFGFLLVVWSWTPVSWILWLGRLPRPRVALDGTGSRAFLLAAFVIALLANWTFLIADGR
ncbi:MAG: hypothetical protein Kow0062_09360 [Acidobacteriota bacterium]